jgi:hypothetical protein
MYLLIEKDGTIIDHRNLGLQLLSFRKQSMEHRHEFSDIDGRNGSIHTGTTFGPRSLIASFLLDGENHIFMQMLIDEIHSLFATNKEVFLIDSRQPGKRWRVLTNNTFDTPYSTPRVAKYDLEFISPISYSESVGTTLDDFTFASDLWQIGMNLPADAELIYRWNTSRFKIYNAGNAPIDPNELPLNIFFKGASNGLTIRNITTGHIFKYNGSTNKNDVITLERLRHLKNGVSIFSETNRNYITIAPGWNEFEIIGTTGSFVIWFDFRFYYY